MTQLEAGALLLQHPFSILSSSSSAFSLPLSQLLLSNVFPFLLHLSLSFAPHCQPPSPLQQVLLIHRSVLVVVVLSSSSGCLLPLWSISSPSGCRHCNPFSMCSASQRKLGPNGGLLVSVNAPFVKPPVLASPFNPLPVLSCLNHSVTSHVCVSCLSVGLSGLWLHHHLREEKKKMKCHHQQLDVWKLRCIFNIIFRLEKFHTGNLGVGIQNSVLPVSSPSLF